MATHKSNTAFPDDLGELPELYASRVSGDCMAPHLSDGKAVIIDKLSPVRPGDFVVVHLNPGRSQFNGEASGVKRLVYAVAHGVTFPFQRRPGDELMPLLVVEQLNPPRRYAIPCDHVRALHRCLGEAVIDPHGRCAIDRDAVASARAQGSAVLP